jgi:hypothetical protein
MLINDASITGSLIVNASSSFQNIAVSGNILPGINNVYNLGSVDKFFKEIFVSTGSINFVDNTGIKTTISSVAGGGIQIGSVQITTSSISFVDITGSVTQTIAQSSSLGSTSNFTPTSSFNEYTQSFSASVSSSITSISSSVTTTITTLSSSVSTSFSLSEASVTSLSSSVSSSVTSLSSSLTSVNTTQNSRLSNIESVTGSYSKLSGGNTFIGTQIVSGSTFIAGDLIVQGSSSIQYISASSVSIGTNTINLNTNTPAVRFAGISIFDSGSNAQTASIFWDGFCNKFVYSNPSSVGYSGGMLISGPRNTGSLGEENGLTTGYLAVSVGSDHISSSAIYHTTSSTCFYGNTTITSTGVLTSTNLVGTICANNGVISGSAQVDGTAITNKSITIAGTSTALGGTITLATMTGGSAIHSGSYLATATTANLSENTNLYYTDTRVKTKLNAETVISGSGQVAIASTSGFGTYINQALLTTSSPTFNTVTATFSGNITGNVTGNVSGTSNNITAYTINQSVVTSDSPSFNQVFSSNNGNGTNYRVGDDAWFGDVNVANTVRLKGVQDATAGYLTFGNQTTQLGLTNSTTLTWGAAFTATGDVTAYSDIRVKENIKTIDNALDKVLRLRGVTFNRIDLDDKSEKMGVIAQETIKVVPQVIIEENDRLSVAYGNLAGLFIEAIKEQQIKIDNLTIEVENLKKPKGL